MGAFEYTALDSAGRSRKGVIEGDTARHVRALLREQQLLPVTRRGGRGDEESRRQRGSPVLASRRGVSAADLSLMTRQLATLVRAGLPLEEALLAVSQQTEKPRVQSIVLGVRAKVVEGHTLAAGLDEFPRVFPEIYRATVSAGEQSGHLDAVLERLADYTESREQMRQKVMGAMLYPIVLTVMCFTIVSILLTYVVPKVVEVFEANRAKLPLATQRTGGRQQLPARLRHLAGAGHRGGLLPGLARAPEARDALALSSHAAAHADHGSHRARLQHRALHAHPEHPHRQRRAGARCVAHRERGGHQPADARCGRLKPPRACVKARRSADRCRQSRLFPPMTIHLISSGESSGQLQTMLERAALNQERELEGLLAALVGLLGPLLIVGMGLFVMGIVFAMLLPIFEMNR